MAMKPMSAAWVATVVLLPTSFGALAQADQRREQVKANFLQADVNQDQHLDLGEFTAFINLNADHGLGRAPTIRRLGMHSRAFGRLDANRDGRVSPEELAAQAQD